MEDGYSVADALKAVDRQMPKEAKYIRDYIKRLKIEIVNASQNDEEQERGGLVNPDGGDYPLKWMSKSEEE